jgi:hypothetical protein
MFSLNEINISEISVTVTECLFFPEFPHNFSQQRHTKPPHTTQIMKLLLILSYQSET